METNKKKESHNLIQGKHTTIGDIAKNRLESTDFTNTSDALVNELKKIVKSDYPEDPPENKQLFLIKDYKQTKSFTQMIDNKCTINFHEIKTRDHTSVGFYHPLKDKFKEFIHENLNVANYERKSKIKRKMFRRWANNY